jgi:hypothetical protein
MMEAAMENPDVKVWIDGWMEQVRQRAEAYRQQGVPSDEAEERAVFEVRMEIRRSPPLRIFHETTT